MILVFPFFYAGVGQLLGQDVDWDLQNYHYFDSYWLLVNHMRDVTPAQLQTYLSPILDTPFYFATQHLPPRITGFLLAVVQGTSFSLLYLINRHFTANRSLALVLAALGMFTAGALGELGTIFGDSLVAPFFLVAILLGLRSFDGTVSIAGRSLSPSVLIATACGISGLAGGLKLAELPIAMGIALAFPLVSGTARQRLQKAVWASAASILGIALSYGWWGYELATRFGNPFLPYFNSIFHSPFAPATSIGGTTLAIRDVPIDPILWTLNPIPVAGLAFREASLPIAEVLLIALTTIAAGRAVVQRQPMHLFSNDKQRFLIALAVVAYLSWSLVFDQYRFLIPIEMLSFTLIFVSLQAISAQIGWRPLVTVGTIALVLICVVSEIPMDWGRSAWSRTYFSASVPKSLAHQRAAFLMLGKNPDAFVVPSFPKQDYFAQIAGNLPPTPHVKQVIVKEASAYRTAYTIWEDLGSQAPAVVSYATLNQQVELYGFQIVRGSCSGFSASVGAQVDHFHTCKLTRVSTATLAPTILVVHPVNGHDVAGKQILDASASDAAGLRKVEFAISGDGRTMMFRATPSLIGWIAPWNTRLSPNGIYTIRGIAVADNGLVRTSLDVEVSLRNTMPIGARGASSSE